MTTCQHIFDSHFIAPSTTDLDYLFSEVSENVCTRRSYASCLPWWCKNAKWWQQRLNSRLKCYNQIEWRKWGRWYHKWLWRQFTSTYATRTARSVIWWLKDFVACRSVPLAWCSNWGCESGRLGCKRVHYPNCWIAWPLLPSNKTMRRKVVARFWASGTLGWMDVKARIANDWGRSKSNFQPIDTC